jgi:hypothetical protein
MTNIERTDLAERITRLEEQYREGAIKTAEISKDVKDIKQTLDNLSGGKQALIWITGIALSIAGIAVAVFHELRSR